MIKREEILELSWAQYRLVTLELAERLRPRLAPCTRVLCLKTPELLEGLFWIGAAVQLGLSLLFDEKPRASELGSEVLIAPHELSPQLGTYSGIQLYPGSPSEAPPLILEQLRVVFKTSGSSGQPKPIFKHAEGLLAEVEVLQRLYCLHAGQHVLGLVRPFHIYGFLHAFLLPLKARARVTLWPLTQHLPLASLPRADLLISVPSQWSFVEALLRETPVHRLVSSGAPFGRDRAQRLKEHPQKPFESWEILGSTETGGMGYRRIDANEDHAQFELLDGVELDESGSDGTWIRSPFIAPEKAAFTADRLELIDELSFRHLGRADRIFKYAGKRYSLPEIEDALSSLCDGAAVVCHFIEDLSRAQGGILRAWVEAKDESDKDERGQKTLDIRVRFLAQHTLPFPQQLICLPQLPRDAQGKVQLEQLLKTAK